VAIPEKLQLTRRQVTIGLSLVVLFLVCLFAWQAWTASRALLDARKQAESVQTLIQQGDFDGANRALADLADDAHRAHSRTGGFLWDIGKHVPYFGKNIGAVQTVSDVLDTASSINAPIALQLSKALNEGTFKPVNGQINLTEVKKLTPEVERAAASIDAAGKALDDLRPDSLLFPFNDMVGKLQDQFDDARSASKATATAFKLLPQMLGETKARNYLLIIQNPAELRSTGGLPGSIAILHAVGGQLTMGFQGSATDVKGFTGPVVKLPKDTEQMYGSTMATDFRDINFTPDFPQAAQIARVMAKQKLHVDVDGVISVDPIAMAYILAATGPVQVDGQTLGPTNVISELLNKVYIAKKTDLLGQDAFFAHAAKTIFNAVMSGQGSQQQAVRGLGTSTSEHRIQLWSDHPDEQAQLTGTAISGGLPSDSGSSPQVGMYLNDSTASKMDYYLQYRSSASAVSCRAKGAQDLRVTVSLKSTMPKDVSGLGISVLGDGEYVKQGDIAFNMRLYAPYGGEVTGLKVNGETQSITSDKHFGRPVAFLPVTLKPGQESTIVAEIRTRAGQDGNGTFSFTPGMVTGTPNGVKIVSACD
jgi:hypothetical protein